MYHLHSRNKNYGLIGGKPHLFILISYEQKYTIQIDNSQDYVLENIKMLKNAVNYDKIKQYFT